MIYKDPQIRIEIMNLLNALQQASGLSQKFVAASIGIDESNLSRIHRGKYTPTLGVLVAIIKAYLSNTKSCCLRLSLSLFPVGWVFDGIIDDHHI